MTYSNIDKLFQICNQRLLELNLNKTYSDRLEQEIKDLKKWQLFIQTDKALELLQLQGQNVSSNKSGSLILFLLQASSIDPLANNLKQEIKKFGKADPPDIDIDLNPEVREPIKAFLVDKFGKEHVCSVGTLGTYKTKNVIQDVVRALDLDLKEAIEVTKGLDAEIGEGDEETKLDKASFDEICASQPALRDYFERHEDVRRHSELLRNQAKNYGTHAGGVIISNYNLLENIPVFKDKSGKIVSSWAESGSSSELSSIGLVKFDLLSLCLEENTLIETDIGLIPIKNIDNLNIYCLNHKGEKQIIKSDEFILIETGIRNLIEIELENGEKIISSPEHMFFKKI